MKAALPLSKSDLMLLRNPVISFLVLSILALVTYVSATRLQQLANDNLSAARVYFDQVSSSVTQIAQEAETIIRYIDRYIQIDTDGVVSAPDRLQFLERMDSIRESLQLYALDLEMGEQISYVMPYPPQDPLPGEPVTVNQTSIDLELPLLHEGDLVRMLDQLLSMPGLFLPTQCLITLDSISTDNFTQLRENLISRCRVNWFSFELTPPAAIAQEG
jgi:Asp-tRNA(Asn)/Glu-tRNA(Gln) amidotransferase C subunit